MKESTCVRQLMTGVWRKRALPSLSVIGCDCFDLVVLEHLTKNSAKSKVFKIDLKSTVLLH